MTDDHDPPIVGSFKADLLRAGPLRKSGRRLGGRVALALTAIALLMLVPLGLRDDGARSEAVAITRANGVVTARIADPAAPPERIEAELRQAGIDARVRSLPVSPSLVGTWASIDARPPLDPDPSKIHQEIAHSTFLRVPERYTGRLRLAVGRPARSGERYFLTGSAFAPREPLHCSGLEQKTVAEVAAALSRRGFRVRWTTIRLTRGRIVETGGLVSGWRHDGPSARAPRQGQIHDARLRRAGRNGQPAGGTIEVEVLLPIRRDQPPHPAPRGWPRQDCGR